MATATTAGPITRSRSPLSEGGRRETAGAGRFLGAALLLGALLAPAPSRAAPGDAAEMALARALFTKGAVPPCALCHTLKDAGTAGAVGPILDELQPDAARVVAALKNGIGAMPSYKATLSEAQIQALARYVAKASGAAN
jgi:cytochrome c6